MPAVIESTLYTAPPPGGAVIPGSTQQNSRNDLRKGYHVVCHSVHEATTYSWTLAFAPNSPGSAGVGTPFDGTVSTASLLPPEGSTSRDCKFNVDYEGAYLLRLVVDAGLPTEDTQFVRLRMLTHFADIKLVSAGERRDQNGVIPVDASPEGWANDQNANFQRILVLLRRLSTSGRVLFVDANRGRDNAHDQNDEDALVHIPGPDAADRERTGIKTQAEGFGDFFTINEAIAYAAAAVARSEAVPSADNPYFIVVYPGFYEEDLNLAAHVHLVSAYSSGFQTVGQDAPVRYTNVLIRTANAGGGTHTFNPGDAAAQVALVGVHLQNTDNTTAPVLRVQGGIAYLHNSTVEQRGNAVNQGEAIRVESANPVTAQMALVNTDIWSDADADDERWAVRVMGPGAVFDADGVFVKAKSGVIANEDLDQTLDVTFQRSILMCDRPYLGYAGLQHFDRTEVLVNAGSVFPAIEVSAFGQPPAAKPGTLDLRVTDCQVSGDISYATAGAAGATTLHYSNVTQLGSGKLVLPDAPGDVPNTTRRGSEAYSLSYTTNFAKPTAGPAAPATIPAPAQSPFPNVQETIDLLMLATFPLGVSPFYSLGSAYDGLASLNPFVLGAGLGRSILADDGAVQITGASAPLAMSNWRKDGGLQVEGILDIGPLVGGAGTDTVAETGGSEIHLNPNPMGAGPTVQLGRAIWPTDISGATVRGLPAALLSAGAKSGAPAPGGIAPYHLNLRTSPGAQSGTGELGRVVVQGGHAAYNQVDAAPHGGPVYIQAGSNDQPGGLGTAGSIWMVPGIKTGGTGGRVFFVGASGNTSARLTAGGPFVGGVSGKVFLATPAGVEVFAVTAVMNLAAVITLINTTSKNLLASDVGGSLRLTDRTFGPHSDVLYVGDDQGGLLNTALGDLAVSGTATWVSGSFGDQVGVSVPAPDVFKVHGTIEADAAIIPGVAAPGVLGPYARIDTLDGPNIGAPYVLAEGTVVLGVMTLAGPVFVQLPAGVTATKFVVVKDEENNALANNITVLPPAGKTLEGQPFLIIAANGGALNAYRGVGGNWFIY